MRAALKERHPYETPIVLFLEASGGDQGTLTTALRRNKARDRPAVKTGAKAPAQVRLDVETSQSAGSTARARTRNRRRLWRYGRSLGTARGRTRPACARSPPCRASAPGVAGLVPVHVEHRLPIGVAREQGGMVGDVGNERAACRCRTTRRRRCGPACGRAPRPPSRRAASSWPASYRLTSFAIGPKTRRTFWKLPFMPSGAWVIRPSSIQNAHSAQAP